MYFQQTRYARVPTQFLIASATIPEEMRSFITQEIPEIKVIESGVVSPARLTHKWVVAPLHRRTETLLQILADNSNGKEGCKKTIIFVQRTEIGEGVLEILENAGHYVTMINGNMSEMKRAVVFKQFDSGQFDIMVATDIIARGIDIPDCEMVIQIQPGPDLEMYQHRAGRAARAGRHGTSIVIVSDSHVKDRELVKQVREVVEVQVEDATTFLRKLYI